MKTKPIPAGTPRRTILTPRTLPAERSQEILERTLEEHADAYLVLALTPAGEPIVTARVSNAVYCLMPWFSAVACARSSGAWPMRGWPWTTE